MSGLRNSTAVFVLKPLDNIEADDDESDEDCS